MTIELPTLFTIKDLRAIYNINFEIKTNYYGAYNSMPYKLRSILLPIANSLNLFENSKIQLVGGKKICLTPFVIKLCGDGTNVGRVKKLLNFNFTVLNEKIRCKTAAGNYSIGMR